MRNRSENREWQTEKIRKLSTEGFLGKIDDLAAETVKAADYHDEKTGYISAVAWKRLVEGGVLASVLLERDPGKRQEEIMRTTRILSFHDLHLGLTYGIVAALGVMPLQRFANNGEQLNEYLEIVRRGNLIGLAITEQFKSGSAALEMDSFYEIDEMRQTVRIKFAKHLQGLSGNAGMIVALLKKEAKRKTVGLFFVPQEVMKTQETKMMGLTGIRYGVNSGDVTLDLTKHLLVELPRERLAEFQDIFTKSRMLFVAMTLGHLEKMEVQANTFADQRIIEGRPQREIPAVQGVLQEIRAHRVITEAIFERVINHRGEAGETLLDGDTLLLAMEANIVKTLSTEYALQAAAMRAELMGGAAFYKDSALQDYIDIWPFQIFEGSKLFINNQICREFFSPTRVNGKIVLPGFLAQPETNFAEYFFKTIQHREMFDSEQILQNTEWWTGQMLIQITPESIKPETRGVMGEIVARLFALGCLKGKNQEGGKAVLNLEISQLAQNFVLPK